MPKDIQVTIEPEDKAAEALSHHIRGSGHAFSMFDAARLVLAEGDRFHARFTCANERPNGLFVTPADGGLFLSQDEAMQHVLRGSAIDSYYRVDEIELEEPKGDFKSIGVCGMTGELLGPPSHHSFQTALIRMHRERFSHMPLEDYKRRIRVESNPDLVTQWKEKQKKGQRWVSLKEQPAEGEEPVTLSSRAEMEAHFRKVHANTAVREVKEAVIAGSIDKAKLTHVLFIMLRNAVDNARKHLFEMSQKLGGGFERRGLKLFKRRAGKLFVSRVKPRAVDPGVVLSERVAKIVESLKSHAGMPLHQLVETLVPSAVPLEPAPEGGAAPKVPLTEEQISVIKDIRWLANEGYVIEYSDGMVCLGVQGEPNPVKAPAAKAAAPATEAAETSEAAPAPAASAEAPAVEAETTVEPAEAPAPVEEAPPAADLPVVEEAAVVETEAEAPVEAAEPVAPIEEAPPVADLPVIEEAPAEAAPETAAAETAPQEEAPSAEAPATEAETVDIAASEAPVPPMNEEAEKEAV
jgi:hypothetical protein